MHTVLGIVGLKMVNLALKPVSDESFCPPTVGYKKLHVQRLILRSLAPFSPNSNTYYTLAYPTCIQQKKNFFPAPWTKLLRNAVIQTKVPLYEK